ncbi:MAG: pantoate--beta-alanine ligase [Nitrospirota bacterium]|nr:pantoate--beta-alanine ligase [Nitrospirota bacterium]
MSERLVATAAELRRRVDGWRSAGPGVGAGAVGTDPGAGGGAVGFVPTMGALHAGHLSLMRRARAECPRVVVSIFVNPRQFGPTEDFGRYPRTLEADLRLCAEAGVDAVFCPAPEEVYPPGFQTTVSVGPLTRRLCGLDRPDHFDGVTTVVARLFGLVRPTHAYFGQKDYQQASVIRRMVADLALEPEIVVCPIVREADGLAMSSRNRYLSADERQRALALCRGLERAQERFGAGERDAAAVTAALAEQLREAGAAVDYAAACDPVDLEPVARLESGTVLLVAARIGATRLLDNHILE